MTPERGAGLTPSQWQRLKALFDEAISRPPAEHPEYLARIHAEDPGLAEHLHSLIRGHHQATSPIDQPLFHLNPEAVRRPLFAAGELVLNRFRISRMLGMGGMGEVYEATDLAIGAGLGRIALKTIRPDVSGSPSVLSRFKQEVALARRVTGPHVCRIHEFFVTEPKDGAQPVAFLTMEFLEGTTLSARLRENTSLSWSERCDIALQLCEGVGAIHAAGIIHRDLKSRNIMLVPARQSPAPSGAQVVVMDFGLATGAAAHSGASESGITLPGAILGTPEYMAPEQFEAKPLSPATDIYALGIVLYEIATGSHPFSAPTPLAAVMRRAKRPPPVSSIRKDVPRRWDQVIDRCLAYEPERRFQSASEVAAALKGRGPNRTFWWIGIAAALVAAAALTGYFLTQRPTGHTNSQQAQAWYDKGTAALREGSYLTATGQLQHAIDADPGFVLAHARLADTWGELDFTGRAQQEMLRASLDTSGRLPRLDRLYLEAIQNTLVLHFGRATDLYREILSNLPEKEKAAGLIDLGRAYEKAGRIEDAIRAFQAARLGDPARAAAYLRLGILETRRKHTSDAEKDFTEARNIFDTDRNVEGLAEVDYQQGFAANTERNLTAAHGYLEQSLGNARSIKSVQLQTRALAALSTNASLAGDTKRAEEYARDAIRMADENRLEYWSIDGLNRLGTAFFAGRDYEQAGRSFAQAQKLAQTSQRPRLEAYANVMLASIRERLGKPGESIPLAQAALDFYQPRGFFNEAGGALVLLNRAMLDQGDYPRALQSGRLLLDNANKAGNPTSLALAHETLGSDLASVGQYPEALRHTQDALDITRRMNGNTDELIEMCAELAWRLGRYGETETLLKQLRPAFIALPDSALDIAVIRGHMRLSQLRFAEVAEIAGQALALPGTGAYPRDVAELKALRGRALARLGRFVQAEQSCQQALADAEKTGGNNDIAEARLALAFVYAEGPRPELSRPLAETARATFVSSGRAESKWLGDLCLARSYQRANLPPQARDAARKALETLREYQQTWTTADRDSYCSRPDIRTDQEALKSLSDGPI